MKKKKIIKTYLLIFSLRFYLNYNIIDRSDINSEKKTKKK